MNFILQYYAVYYALCSTTAHAHTLTPPLDHTLTKGLWMSFRFKIESYEAAVLSYYLMMYMISDYVI